MRILFVRHGDPDYKHDCLTPKGHIQAEAAAERLAGEKIDKIYSSSCGRAYETALHIAEKHNLEVEKLDFMREVPWGDIDGNEMEFKGNPWNCAAISLEENKLLMNPDWRNDKLFRNNKVTAHFPVISANFDTLLAKHGYEREGQLYRVKEKNDDTIMIVSHGGSSSCVFAHLFNLPLTFACLAWGLNLTSISIVKLGGEEGLLINPKIELFNDSKHIKDIPDEATFDR